MNSRLMVRLSRRSNALEMPLEAVQASPAHHEAPSCQLVLLPEAPLCSDEQGRLCCARSVAAGQPLATLLDTEPQDGDSMLLWCGGPRRLWLEAQGRLSHSCDPSATFDRDGLLRARFPLAAGSVLSINRTLVERDELLARPRRFRWLPAWSSACQCASPICLGLLDGWRLRENRRPVQQLGHDRYVPMRPRLEVRECGTKGRGVFANSAFCRGELLECAPVIVIPSEQVGKLEATIFDDYTYAFGGEPENLALALGLGSLINHAYEPNAIYHKRLHAKTIEYYAIRTIAVGEEITINYNGNPRDVSPLWFHVDAERLPELNTSMTGDSHVDA